jgi:Cu/Ag efflux protein CusF
MRRVVLTILLLLVAACPAKREPAAKENVYAMTGTIVSRDPAQNLINLDHKEIPGVMEAMRMDYPVRGAKVSSLPPDGSAVEAKLHEQDGRYWITDVRPVSAASSPAHR